MTQTWWLSFCDPDKPEGQQFLGAAIVDVDVMDVARAEPSTTAIRAAHDLPPLIESGARWMAAAVWKSHRLKCNPGGAVATLRIDEHPDFATIGPRYPRGRLLSRAEIDALDQAVEATPPQ